MNKIDLILKIAGVKTPQELYKKFKSEEEFMAKHGGEFRKAQLGITQGKLQQPAGLYMPGITPLDINKGMNAKLTTPTFNDAVTTYRKNATAINAENTAPKTNKFNPAVLGNMLGNTVKGFQLLKDEKRKVKEGLQAKGVSEVLLKRSQLLPEDRETPEYALANMSTTGEEFFPVFGTGSNVLAKKGKKIKKAGVGDILQGIGQDKLSNIAVGLSGGESAGSTLGGVVGDAVGMIPGLGPVAKMLVKPAAQVLGNIFDNNPEKYQSLMDDFDMNVDKIAMQNNRIGMYNKHMKEGGNLNPQVIKYFGGNKLSDLLELRSGGNLRQNEGMNGELQILDGGGLEEISNNPFSDSPTYNLSGRSHNDGGIKIAFGEEGTSIPEKSIVEGENNEPIQKIGEDAVIWGDRKVPGEGITFKKKVRDIAKQEEKYSNILDESMAALGNSKKVTSTDLLTENTNKAMALGASMKLKMYDEEKTNLASLQETLNQIKEMKSSNAKKGKTVNPYKNSLLEDWTGRMDAIEQDKPFEEVRYKAPVEGKKAGVLKRVKEVLAEREGEEPSKNKWYDLLTNTASTLMPYLRPSDIERLDPRQIMGELLALGDKEEPVQARYYTPQLSTPYSISLQDQKNDIISQIRAAQRMAGGNSAAQSMISAQAYEALNKINAEEFRLNQAMKDRTYGENRNVLNQAELQNLQIGDQQYVRQTQAAANTEATKRAALESLGDKYLKNKLENRTLAAYENLYNYRFDPRFRAWNYNEPAKWDTEIRGAATSKLEPLPQGYEYIYNQYGQPIDIRKGTGVTASSKGGIKTNAKNGALIRMVNSL